MRVFLYVGLVVFSMGCTSTENKQPNTKVDTIIIKAPSILETRDNPSKKPVAAFSVPIDDGMGNANNWKFGVNIYETKKTFEYKVNIQFKEIRATEIIQIPNFNIVPTVLIKPGKSTLDCIIGFKDTKGLFKDYYQVSVKNDQLKFKKINSFSVVKYKTVVK